MVELVMCKQFLLIEVEDDKMLVIESISGYLISLTRTRGDRFCFAGNIWPVRFQRSKPGILKGNVHGSYSGLPLQFSHSNKFVRLELFYNNLTVKIALNRNTLPV